MLPSIAIAFLVGFFVAGIGTFLGVYEALRCRSARRSKEQHELIHEAQQRGMMLNNCFQREALKDLEFGNVEGARHRLAASIAGFYRHYTEATAYGGPAEAGKIIQHELHQIEEDAKSAGALHSALNRQPATS